MNPPSALTASEPPLLCVKGLSKAFGKRAVLSEISFALQPGSITAILGPNASGKSTLIKSILGLVRPDQGEISLEGLDLSKDPSLRAKIGYMHQIARFPENLRIHEILSMLEDLRPAVSSPDREIYETFQLHTLKDQPIRVFSGGTKQKLNAALAFWFRPPLLILDEPSVGLDPLASLHLKQKIRRERDQGRTILFTSHIMGEVEELADQILFLLDGKLLFHGACSKLKAQTHQDTLEKAVVALLSAPEPLSDAATSPRSAEVSVSASTSASEEDRRPR